MRGVKLPNEYLQEINYLQEIQKYDKKIRQENTGDLNCTITHKQVSTRSLFYS